MSSATDICNLALLHLKSALRVGNISTGKSEMEQICSIVYPIVRDKFQADRPWSFCKKTAALVQTATNPNPVWAYGYAYFPDCLFFRRILPLVSTPGSQTEIVTPPGSLVTFGALQSPQEDVEQTVVPFETDGVTIFTNMPNAVGVYTQRNTNEGTWPAQVVLAMSYAVAEELAPAVTDGDPFQMIEKMRALAQQKANEAAASNANERVVRQSLSEFTRRR